MERHLAGFRVRMERGWYRSLLLDQIMKGIKSIYVIIQYEMWRILYRISRMGPYKNGL